LTNRTNAQRLGGTKNDAHFYGETM